MASSETGGISNSAIQEELSILRCKKCRRRVVDSSCLHSPSEVIMTGCSVWHVDINALPDWIVSIINDVHWTSGRLNCQHCGARLGGFNFLNCPRCPCGHGTTVHFIKSRVDQVVKHLAYVSRPSTTRVHMGFQVKHRNLLEGPDKRNTCLNLHKLTYGLEPRFEFQSRQIQPNEPPIISSCICPLSLPLICPVHEEISDLASHDADRQAPLTPIELSDQLQYQDGCLDDFFPSSTHYMEQADISDIVMEQADISDIVMEQADISDIVMEQADISEMVMEQAEISEGVAEETQNHVSSTPLQMLTKREKNRIKSLRRKQRKKERWIQRQLGKSVSWNLMSNDAEKEGYICAVCLDLYYRPFKCQPCSHVFCEPCLRTLAKGRASKTPCPLCRTLISHVISQEDLHQHIRTHFPDEYCIRSKTFQKTNYSKWPLPSSPEHFRILMGLRRCTALAVQWQFPLRALGLDDMRGWTFWSDMVNLIFSFPRVLSCLIILCGLFYILLL